MKIMLQRDNPNSPPVSEARSNFPTAIIPEGVGTVGVWIFQPKILH